MKTRKLTILFLGILPFCLCSYSQDSTLLGQVKTEKYLRIVDEKAEKFNRQVDNYTTKTLNKILKQEKKMQRKMMKVDSILAKNIFSYAIDSLQKLQNYLKNKEAKLSSIAGGKYFPYLDTLKQSLAFFGKAKELLGSVDKVKGNVSSALDEVKGIEGKLESVGKIQEYLKERQSVLKDQVKSFPFLAKYIKRVNKETYYYTAQINEYKTVLSDPSKIENLVVTSLSKIPAFQKFMAQNSQLASLFPIGGSSSGGSGNIPIVNGIPTRFAVQQAIQTSFGGTATNVSQLLNQQIGQAQGIVDKLKNKVNEMGGMDDKEIPDFRPNKWKTKSFWKRLEYGTDLQFGKSTNFLPATSNISLQLGYKLDDRSSIGFAGAYRLGLGNGWNDINITHQGIGLRSYLNWKIKGSFYVQGGSEWNYNTAFRNIDQLKDHSLWQHSALLGVSKKYKISKKLKGNIQAMFDFLYKQHIPHSQPVLFRFGYGF